MYTDIAAARPVTVNFIKSQVLGGGGIPKAVDVFLG